MRSFFASIFISAIISSCVSKKKYDEKTAQLNLAESRIHYLKKDSTAKQNRIDSLVKDSAVLAAKITELKKPSIVYYKQTISEEKEYEMKMIFVYNIATNTEWENEYKKSDFVIGVLGKSKITDEMKTGLTNKKKAAQNFSIEEYNSVAAIKNCHLLFVTNAFYSSLGSIKNKISKYPTLIVTEQDFSGAFAHFNLAVDGDVVKLFANKDAIKKASFKVSKNLLNIVAN